MKLLNTLEVKKQNDLQLALAKLHPLIGDPDEVKAATLKRSSLVSLLLNEINVPLAQLESHLKCINTIRYAKTWRIVDDDDPVYGGSDLMAMVACELVAVYNTSKVNDSVMIELMQLLDAYVNVNTVTIKLEETKKKKSMTEIAKEMREIRERLTCAQNRIKN